MSSNIAQASSIKKLFVVHSYSSTHVCGAPQEHGLIDFLAKKGWDISENLDFKVFHMDTKKRYTKPEEIVHRGKLALAEIERYQPDVVVVLDDNAFKNVGLKLLGKPNISVVFSGVNGQPEAYNQTAKFMEDRQHPTQNITGVYEKLWISKSLAVMKEAIGNFKSKDEMVIIVDQSPTGKAIQKQVEIELEKSAIDVNWHIEVVKNFTQYEALIKRLNQNTKVKAIYPAALSLTLSNGETWAGFDIIKWTIAHSQKPEMALNFSFTQLGYLGGASVDFYQMGQQVGAMVAKIFNGQPVSQIPIEDAKEYSLAFNSQRAKKLKFTIPESLLLAADRVYLEKGFFK